MSLHFETGSDLYTVAAVFEVALQYSPRCNIARKQADVLAIEPALQYNPQILLLQISHVTFEWLFLHEGIKGKGIK